MEPTNEVTNNKVTNESANKLIEGYKVKHTNQKDLSAAKQVNEIEISETVGDLRKQAEVLFPFCRAWKFGGQSIRILVFFNNGETFSELTLKSYEGKVETLAKTVASKIFNTFATLKGKGKMNVLLEFDGVVERLKTGRVYHMTKNNMQHGISALTIIQAHAYLKDSQNK